MSIFEIGRLCVKLAGRDAGNKCVIAEELGKGYVIVDGNVRRKKVNVKHLEPLKETLKVGKGSHEDVKKAFEKLGLPVRETKPKKAAARQKKQKAKKEKKTETAKQEKKTAKPKKEKQEEATVGA